VFQQSLPGHDNSVQLSALAPDCVKTIFRLILRKIDSRPTRQTEQSFTIAKRLFQLLRESIFSQRFYTAWVNNGH